MRSEIRWSVVVVVLAVAGVIALWPRSQPSAYPSDATAQPQVLGGPAEPAPAPNDAALAAERARAALQPCPASPSSGARAGWTAGRRGGAVPGPPGDR